MWMHEGPFMWGIMGWIWMVVFWALVILGITALLKWLLGSGNNRSNAGGESPLEVLKIRYAKGEIDKEEFEEKKRDILLS